MTHAKTERMLAEVRRPFFLALLLFVAVYLIGPFFDWNSGKAARIGDLILWFGLSGGALLVTYGCRSERRIAKIVFPLLVALTILGAITGDDPGLATTIQGVLFSALIVVITLLALEYVILAKRVDADAIFASMCTYFLLAVLWAFLYSALASGLADSTPPAFEPDPLDQATESTFGSLLYFSFVTLTTLGYGDMSPTHPVTRAFATMEAFVGQMFVAILVARLVSIQLMERARRLEG